MKNLVLAVFAIFFAAIASAAVAADYTLSSRPDVLYAPPAYTVPYNWTGGYAGLIGSYLWNRNTTVVKDDPLVKDNGFGIGGVIGFGQQFGQFYAGIEADLSKVRVSGSFNQTWADQTYNYSLTDRANMDLFGTARLRIGYLPTDQLLVYVTGGAAGALLGHDRELVTSNHNGTWVDTWSAKYAGFGWTAGAGLELAVAKNIRLRGEVLYYNLGSSSISAVNSENYQTSAKTSDAGITARVGVIGTFN